MLYRLLAVWSRFKMEYTSTGFSCLEQVYNSFQPNQVFNIFKLDFNCGRPANRLKIKVATEETTLVCIPLMSLFIVSTYMFIYFTWDFDDNSLESN